MGTSKSTSTQISIHAPRVGSDFSLTQLAGSSLRFQSTLPVWGATPRHLAASACKGISIHAPRVGSDKSRRYQVQPVRDFNPRSPCGERHNQDNHRKYLSDFNPRSPCGERRYEHSYHQGIAKFQSTLPVWGATLLIRLIRDSSSNFNPRSPCGERLTPLSDRGHHF